MNTLSSFNITKFVSLVLLSLALFSCSVKAGGDNDNSDNCYSEDTLVEEVITEVEPIEDYVESYVPSSTSYFSKDYQTYNLKGKVKKVFSKTLYDDNDSKDFYVDHEFGEDGLEIFDRWDDSLCSIEVKRSPDGLLLEIISHEGIDFRTKFHYTEDEWVKAKTASAESSTTEEFIRYNEYGEPLESKLYGECYGEPDFNCKAWGRREYEYLSRDDQGNWTLRVVRSIDYEDSSTRLYKEERRYEYY